MARRTGCNTVVPALVPPRRKLVVIFRRLLSPTVTQVPPVPLKIFATFGLGKMCCGRRTMSRPAMAHERQVLAEYNDRKNYDYPDR